VSIPKHTRLALFMVDYRPDIVRHMLDRGNDPWVVHTAGTDDTDRADHSALSGDGLKNEGRLAHDVHGVFRTDVDICDVAFGIGDDV